MNDEFTPIPQFERTPTNYNRTQHKTDMEAVNSRIKRAKSLLELQEVRKKALTYAVAPKKPTAVTREASKAMSAADFLKLKPSDANSLAEDVKRQVYQNAAPGAERKAVRNRLNTIQIK